MQAYKEGCLCLIIQNNANRDEIKEIKNKETKIFSKFLNQL